MSPAGDPFERLPRSLRTRLDAFSARVDAVPTDQLQLLAVVPFRGGPESARERASEMAQRTSRTAAVEAIRELAVDYVSKRYSGLIQDPRLPFLGRSAAGTRGPERARLAGSFGDALVAIALSDVLDAEDVEMLLGPWAELADGATSR
jgi:hypothetical protein